MKQSELREQKNFWYFPTIIISFCPTYFEILIFNELMLMRLFCGYSQNKQSLKQSWKVPNLCFTYSQFLDYIDSPSKSL